MTDTEIETVRREYRNLMKDKDASDLAVDEKWAETEIRAAIDGVIVEKNFNVGMSLIRRTIFSRLPI